MLAVVSTPENTTAGRPEMAVCDGFPDFSADNLIESIDFDDLFAGMDDRDMLPDLKIDADLFAGEFNLSGEEDSSCFSVDDLISRKKDDQVSQISDESGAQKPKSSSSSSKNSSQGKRKVKVDWTPELHRRFVQAVEQLGVDKAVPSRILEIMGIGCLTRHNIASHLQKYRSHRKHLLAREAEAASWSQRRQMYGGSAAMARGDHGGGSKKDMGPWVAPPTMGFPPMTPVPHYRPLHVWGHPSMERPLMHIWPKHMAHSPPSPQPAWHPHHQRAPYFPQILRHTRFSPRNVQVQCLPPASGIGITTPPMGQTCPQPPLDLHPSKESIDAAIGDILSKPWQPLPLGLKPPALDSVMGELQKQGIQKVPPSCV